MGEGGGQDTLPGCYKGRGGGGADAVGEDLGQWTEMARLWPIKGQWEAEEGLTVPVWEAGGRAVRLERSGKGGAGGGISELVMAVDRRSSWMTGRGGWVSLLQVKNLRARARVCVCRVLVLLFVGGVEYFMYACSAGLIHAVFLRDFSCDMFLFFVSGMYGVCFGGFRKYLELTLKSRLLCRSIMCCPKKKLCCS